MKYLITCGLCLMGILLLPYNAFAQNLNESPAFSPKIAVKYSLFSILEPESAAQLGLEYLYKPKRAFQQQLGYIFYSPTSDVWGIRSRSELKFYLKGDHAQGYFSMEVLYKFMQNYGTEDFDREQGAYIQTIDFRANRNTIGFMSKIGLTNNMLKANYAVDLAFGIGAKATYYNSNVPDDASLNFNDDLFFTDVFFNGGLRNRGYEVLPNIYFGVLIGFVAN